METVDLSLYSLFLAALLLVVPLCLSVIVRIGLVNLLLSSALRMSLQLVLIGIFLKYLFIWNNPFLNILWLSIMILAAVVSAIGNTSIRISKVLFPTYCSFFLATFIIVLFLNGSVIRLDYVFDARYLIVLGGMLLGNSLRGNIIGVTSFYNNIKRDSKQFQYRLSLGASFMEAILPYFRESVQLALKPTLASMATMGIVFLPGMMTGVILGGASPEIAIKYQIMIMCAIVASTIISVFFTIFMTLRVCFYKSGVLKQDIFV